MSEEFYSDSGDSIFFPIKFKQSIDSEKVLAYLNDALTSGLYSKVDPLISILSNTSITVGQFNIAVRNPDVTYEDSVTEANETEDLSTSIIVKSSKTISGIDFLAPYIVFEFLYTQTQTPVPSVKNVAFKDLDLTKQVVLGKCLYRDNSGTKDELYAIDTRNTTEKSVILKAADFLQEFTAVPISDFTINVSGGLIEAIDVVDITVGYNVGTGVDFDLTIPAPGFHRYDLVYVDDNNVLVAVEGQVEANAGSDEHPKPDKINLALFDFPVAFVYISGNHGVGVRVVETADIENITPRFTKKLSAQSLGTEDIIITSQSECDAYFGLNDLLDQGGTTPGLADDGFVVNPTASISLSGVKTVTVPGKNVVFKNQFDVLGDSIPYDIYNRVILTNQSKIHRNESVSFRLINTYSGFYVEDETNMLVETYSASILEILSENTYYTDITQGNYNTQYQLGDSLPVALSTIEDSSEVINTRYNTTAAVKNVSDLATKFTQSEILTSSTNVDSSDFDVVVYDDSGTDKVYFTYIRSGDIYIQGFTYNTTTKTFDALFAENKINSGAITYVRPRIVIGTTQIVVVAQNVGSSDLTFWNETVSDDAWSSTAGGTQIATDDIGVHAIHVDGEDVYIAGISLSGGDVNKVGYNKLTWGGASFTSTSWIYFGTDASLSLNIDIITDGSIIYVTFQENSSPDYLAYAKFTVSWVTGILDDSDVCGHESKLSKVSNPTDTGITDIIVAYTFGGEKEIVKTGILSVDSTGNELEQITTVLTGTTGLVGYKSLSLFINNDNLFGSKPLIQVSALFERGTEVIDTGSGDDVGIRISMAADSQGFLHVTYFDETANRLKYATNQSGSWVTETLDATQGGDDIGRYSTIIVDEDDVIHVAFSNDTDNTMHYATGTAGSWIITVIDSGATGGTFLYMVQDPDGRLYIAHKNDTANVPRFSHLNLSDEWENGNAEGVSTDSGNQLSTVFNRNGKPAILHIDVTASDLVISELFSFEANGPQYDNEGSIETSGMAATTYGKTAIILDKNGNYIVAYYQDTDNELKFAVHNGTGDLSVSNWTFTTVDTGVNVGVAVSMILDRNNNPVISYGDVAANDLKFAQFNGTSWVITTYSSTDSLGRYTDIVKDSQGRLSVAFYNLTNTSLEIVHLDRFLEVAQSLHDTSWSFTSKGAVTYSDSSLLGYLNNDYLFTFNYDSLNAKTTWDKFFYTINVTLAETLPLGFTGLILSPEPQSDINVDLSLDGQKGSVSHDFLVSISNAISGFFKLIFKNAQSDAGVLGGNLSGDTGVSIVSDPKGFGNVLKVDIEDSKNLIYHNIMGVNHSEVSESKLKKTLGEKNFSNCNNIGVSAKIEGFMHVGSGDYDS